MTYHPGMLEFALGRLQYMARNEPCGDPKDRHIPKTSLFETEFERIVGRALPELPTKEDYEEFVRKSSVVKSTPVSSTVTTARW